MAMDLSRKIASVDLDFLKAAASNTGGRDHRHQRLAGGIDRIFDENSSYHLLGFASRRTQAGLDPSAGSPGQSA
jgi:hypothetical protein